VSEDLRRVRIEKLERLRQAGVDPYPERFDRTHTLGEAAGLPKETRGLRLAGRLIAVRTFGKLTFAHLQDGSGKLQIALRKGELDAQSWELFHELCDRGDFVGVEGDLFRTKKGELTLAVRALQILGKALRPLPEKWHGLKDPEQKLRQRHLDLVMSEETRARFRLRTQVTRALRRFLDAHGFEEVETPILQRVPSGAAARPFVTHHHALDLDVYLSIAPETWLKRLIAGGYDRVYEFARCFRNEGMDPSHLQEFTMLEYYCAYWNWEDNLRFTEQLMRHLLEQVRGSLQLEWRGRTIDFAGEWPRLEMSDLIRDRTGIDLAACPTVDELRGAITAKGIEIERIKILGRGALIDALYKTAVRDALVQPCFVTGVPADTLPLARRNDAAPHLADCFQLVVHGWEIVKAYSELVDPLDQRERFREQERLRTGGDEEAMYLDEDYLHAMEHGLPPVSGWGMGIDRVCALLAGTDSLRDVILFPLLRPAARQADEAAGGADVSADVEAFGMSRPQAMELFREHVHGEYLTRHCLASAAVMEAVAEHFDKPRDTYWCMGLLHDLDFEQVPEPEKHTLETVRILQAHGVTDETILHAILSHNEEGLGIPRETWLDFALSCSETVTGLVMATALVMPDKKLASVKPASVKKRMKRKDFARQVSRERILLCERIGLELLEFCEIAVRGMQGVAAQLGL
jgi:lysyl-tRNA synthetase class 2